MEDDRRLGGSEMPDSMVRRMGAAAVGRELSPEITRSIREGVGRDLLTPDFRPGYSPTSRIQRRGRRIRRG